MATRKQVKRSDVSRALNALRRMVRGLRSAAENVERDLNISAAQLFVMRELAQRPDQSVKDLADVTMTTHSTVSQVAGSLIAKGFITRATDPADGRRSVLRLTRQGSSLLRKSPRAIQEELIDGFSLLRASDQRGLANGLEKWLVKSGLGEVPSSMLFEKPLLRSKRKRARAAGGPESASPKAKTEN
jgi:DNA-binding MarR family transcriptional regulator